LKEEILKNANYKQIENKSETYNIGVTEINKESYLKYLGGQKDLEKYLMNL
jgi:hypothetical protein